MSTWRLKSSSDTDDTFVEVDENDVETGATRVDFHFDRRPPILAYNAPPAASKARPFLAGLSAGIVGTFVFEAGRYLLS